MLRQYDNNPSLRMRLFLGIFTPLLLVSLVAAIWRVQSTIRTANEVFDRNLTAISVAVARDIASTGGELLAAETIESLESASGGQVFYHVLGPDGAYVSGFGFPPRTQSVDVEIGQVPVLFDGVYTQEDVRIAKLTQFVNSDGLEGQALIHVWQSTKARQRFARTQALQTLAVIILMDVVVMAFIWFGVGSGLAPLLHLRDAISSRSPQDLQPIQREVPEEVQPLVTTLNALFEAVSVSMDARETFISNASHQLRNPISAIQALAESALSTDSEVERHKRLVKTLDEARHTSQLAEQLLALEKLRATVTLVGSQTVDLGHIALECSRRLADRILDSELDFSFDAPDKPVLVKGDVTLLTECIENLVDNATRHGGTDLTKIKVSVQGLRSSAVVTVEDNGVGIAPENREMVFERFAQLDHGSGSGLGLAIVKEIVRAHAGTIRVLPVNDGPGARFEMRFPLAKT